MRRLYGSGKMEMGILPRFVVPPVLGLARPEAYHAESWMGRTRW